MAKLVRDFSCAFHNIRCNDERCTPDICASAIEAETAFRRYRRTDLTPDDKKWQRLFVSERRKLIRAICWQNNIRYSQSLSEKYLDDPRVVSETLRLMRQKSTL